MTQPSKQPITAARLSLLKRAREGGIRNLLESKIIQMVSSVCAESTSSTVVGKVHFPGVHYDNRTNGVTMSVVLTCDFDLADIEQSGAEQPNLDPNETSDPGTLWHVVLDRLKADFESALCPLWRHSKRAVQSKPFEHVGRLAIGNGLNAADPGICGMVQAKLRGTATFWLDNRPKIYLRQPGSCITSLEQMHGISGFTLPELFNRLDLSKYDIDSDLSAQANALLKGLLPLKTIHTASKGNETILHLGANDIIVPLDEVKLRSADAEFVLSSTLEHYLTRARHVIGVSENNQDLDKLRR